MICCTCARHTCGKDICAKRYFHEYTARMETCSNNHKNSILYLYRKLHFCLIRHSLRRLFREILRDLLFFSSVHSRKYPLAQMLPNDQVIDTYSNDLCFRFSHKLNFRQEKRLDCILNVRTFRS